MYSQTVSSKQCVPANRSHKSSPFLWLNMICIHMYVCKYTYLRNKHKLSVMERQKINKWIWHLIGNCYPLFLTLSVSFLVYVDFLGFLIRHLYFVHFLRSYWFLTFLRSWCFWATVSQNICFKNFLLLYYFYFFTH